MCLVLVTALSTAKGCVPPNSCAESCPQDLGMCYYVETGPFQRESGRIEVTGVGLARALQVSS